MTGRRGLSEIGDIAAKGSSAEDDRNVLFRTTMLEDLSSSSSPQSFESKVPIPRVASETVVTPPPRRVKHACDECRTSRAKCDGQQPTCSRCQSSERICVYSDGKREKTTKYVVHHIQYGQIDIDAPASLREIRHLKTQVHDCTLLLQSLYPKLDTRSQKRIEEALAQVGRTQSSYRPVVDPWGSGTSHTTDQELEIPPLPRRREY